MKHLHLSLARPATLALAAFLLACSSRKRDEPQGGVGVASKSNSHQRLPNPALAPGKPLGSAAADASGKKNAADPAEPEAPADPPFDAFVKRLEREAKVDPDPQSEAEAVSYYAKMHDQALVETKRLVAGLDAERRAYLLAPAEPRRRVADDWHPAWNRFVEGTILVDDFAEYPGPQRGGGTLRAQMIGANFAWAAIEGLYWVETYAQGRARDFALHVRTGAKQAPLARKTQAQLLAAAEGFVKVAPEAARADDACMMCVMADRDYAKVVRTLKGLSEAAPRLADSLCRSWPELASELGGSRECAGTLEDFFVAMAGAKELDGALPEPEPAPEEPPPLGAAYARYAEPLFEHCSLDANDDTKRLDAIGRCFSQEFERRAAQSKKAHAEAAPRLLGEWQSYLSDLCAAEGIVNRDTWLWLGRRSYSQCDWLSTLRVSFFLRAWTDDDASFAAQVAYRQKWANERVTPALANLKARAALRACAEGEESLPKDGKGDAKEVCRESSLGVAEWKTLEGLVTRLPERARSLGALTCESWPKLAATLGSACAPQMASYYLSYAHALGAMPGPGE